ncbi:MAG: DUF4147 domain-containing protein [Gemmatimonadales bacterium]|nr:DUF4147 domain-containing protein [Gemmatimonadales bacterium]
MNPPTDRLRHDAIAIYGAAVAAVEPRRALTRALATTPPPQRVRILAMGKAAFPMAAAAIQHLDRLDIPVTGGVVITPDQGESPDPRVRRIAGDHPLPGAGSFAAAAALEQAVAQLTGREEAWVLISGGTTSLIGAPIEGLSPVEYDLLMRALGRAGLPIGDLNRIRKRFSRWGGGRLAVACRAERVRAFVLSDVPGDHPADIGSGPCEPDPTTASEIRQLLETVRATVEVPEVATRLLDRVIRGDLAETPKPGDPGLARVATRVVASNGTALDGAGERARALGYRVIRHPGLIIGDAAGAGRALVRDALAADAGTGTAWIAGGETTVALGGSPGRGGRCQELALAAARELAAAPARRPIVVLAGGTDGRDGPTDAAGAVVDPTTWATIADRGIDPERALAGHDAYPALAAAGALLRQGLTGTNVMDVMVALVGEGTGPQSGSRPLGNR